MARKTDEQYNNMTVNQLKDYTSEHPKEGARTSKVLGKAAAECLGIYFDDKIESAKNIMTPKQLKEESI